MAGRRLCVGIVGQLTTIVPGKWRMTSKLEASVDRFCANLSKETSAVISIDDADVFFIVLWEHHDINRKGNRVVSRRVCEADEAREMQNFPKSLGWYAVLMIKH
jgi:hypothetical protein